VKFCAGGIPEAAFHVVPVEEYKNRALRLDKYHFSSGGEKHKTGIIKDGVFSVDRSSFDQALADKAGEAGTEIFEDCRIREAQIRDGLISVSCLNGKVFTGKYLVGADGGNSAVSRIFEFSGKRHSDKNMGFCAYYNLIPDQHTFEELGTTAYLDFNFIPGSFAGIIPKKDHLWVGIYTCKKAEPEKIKKALNDFIKTAGIKGEPGKFRGCPIPLYQKNKTIVKGNILLAGEAAGLVNPLSGEGIKPALDSGKIAAEAILANMREGRPLSGYSDRIHREIGENLDTAWKFAHIAYLFPGTAYDGMIHVADDAVKIMNGSLTYKDFEVRLRNKILRTIGIRL
jgi:flavin-dependent dehydrogenase